MIAEILKTSRRVEKQSLRPPLELIKKKKEEEEFI